MRDQTTTARMERALITFEAHLVTLQSLLGRLDLASASATPAVTPPPPVEPPVDSEQQKKIDEWIAHREKEQQAEWDRKNSEEEPYV